MDEQPGQGRAKEGESTLRESEYDWQANITSFIFGIVVGLIIGGIAFC